MCIGGIVEYRRAIVLQVERTNFLRFTGNEPEFIDVQCAA